MATIFRMDLNLPKTFQRGNRIQGVFTLTNLSSEDHQVLIWNTPLEGLISNCFKVTFAGLSIPYDGRHVMRLPTPPANAYLTLPAGGSATAEFDLSNAYYIKDTGNYEIEITSNITTLTAKDAASMAPRASASFKVVDGKMPPVETEGMKYRIKSDAKLSEKELDAPTSPTITGGTPAEQTTLSLAWTNGYSFQIRAIRALSSTDYDTIFTNTFKVTANEANKATAGTYYTSMKSAMGSSSFTLTINPTQDPPGVIAYTTLGGRTIWFEPLFFTYCTPIRGDFSQPAVMVHELSHAVCSAPDCDNALFCSYPIGYFSARVYSMEYNLTLPKGLITVRNGIFKGSNTTAIWSPCNPNENGGWMDGDKLHVVCTFNLNPPINPLPGASEYAGLCAGACSDTNPQRITQLIQEAENIAVPNPGQLLGTHSGDEITTNSTPSNNNIFYSAQSTTGTFQLTPPSRGTLNDYIYKWVMTYNGNNTVVSDGNHVEIIFGYGDPMNSEVDS